jgi:hypothetical protein
MAESRSISDIDFAHTPPKRLPQTMDDNNSTEVSSIGASDVPTGQENVTNEVGSLALYYNNNSNYYVVD